tara:strand:- start:745 stop:1107 length:363 start_codon:yes stop_codon:yes gene_type:complete
MKKKTFYRVANTTTNQGLWYDIDGNFTGLIHKEYDFCRSNVLPMPFDENVVGYLSCTDTLDDLFEWFPMEDIIRLEKGGYYLTVYESEDYKSYHNHWVFNQNNANFIKTIPMSTYFITNV